MPATIHTLHPRQRRNRDMDRGRRAAAAVRAAGGGAMAAALAQIGATFNEAAIVNTFKCRVEHYIALGTGHPAVRARYGARAFALRGHSLETAIVIVDRWYRDERKAFQLYSAFGRAPRLSLEVLTELRLILHLIRRSDLRGHYPGIISFVAGVPETARAAVEG